MRHNGKSFKAISFTLLKEKLLDRSKQQTMRMLFMPTYIEKEIVAIIFKDKITKEKEFLFLVEITEIYPKKLRDITLQEAQLDGFTSIPECQECLMELNHRKLDHFVFLTRWKDIKPKQPRNTLENFVIGSKS